MDWQLIPDLPLQRIFEYLGKRDRLHAALSCRRWYDAFYNPQLWRKFVFEWRPFPADQHKRMYDWEMYRLYLEFLSVGRFFRYVIVPSNSDFYALHGFLQQWRLCIENHITMGFPLQLQSFHLTFASEIIGNQAFGTGGRLLDTLKEVLSRMVGLQSLVLDDLLLDVTDALTVLDEVIITSALSVQRLSVVSICKESAGFYAAAFFPNLQILRLSPIHLNTDLLAALSRETRLYRIILRQDDFTMWPRGGHQLQYSPPSDVEWKRVVKSMPWMRVRLEICGVDRPSGRKGNDLVMWPARYAPVDQVFFDYGNPANDGLHFSLEMVIILAEYSATLQEFGYLRDQHESIIEDPFAWSELISVCRNLEVLYLPNRMSTWFLIMIAGSLRRLQQLHVRYDMIFCEEMPRESCRSCWKDVGDEIFDAAVEACQTIPKAEREIAFLLQLPSWRFLTDDEYRRVHPLFEEEIMRG